LLSFAIAIVQRSIVILHQLTLGQVFQHIESDTLYHAFGGEVLFHIGVLHLLFFQLEDCSVETLLECVVVESPNRHLLVRVWVLHKLEKLVKHLRVVAAIKLFLILLLLFLCG